VDVFVLRDGKYQRFRNLNGTHLPCCKGQLKDTRCEAHHSITLPHYDVVSLLDGINVRGEVLVNLMLASSGWGRRTFSAP
jgi:hypothetical protein